MDLFYIKNYQYIFINYFERNIDFYAEARVVRNFSLNNMVVFEICSMDGRGLASDKIKRRYRFLMCRQSYNISLLIGRHCNIMGIEILIKNAFQFEM